MTHPMGLAAYVQTGDMERARRVSRRMRAGGVSINGTSQDYMAPFGGYKQSGNGREYGEWGLRDFLEIKVDQRVSKFHETNRHRNLRRR